MKTLNYNESRIIADNNNLAVSDLIQERKAEMEKAIKFYKSLCILFIVVLVLVQIFS